MTQSVILRNFIQYLEYFKADYLNELAAEKIKFPRRAKRIAEQQVEFKKYIEKLLLKLKDGHCFGFAVTHGSMGDSTDLVWWENALVAIANWDKHPDSLDKVVDLPGARAETNPDIAKKFGPPTLRRTFRRALDYVVPSQAAFIAEFFPNLEQDNLLKPDGHVFKKPASTDPKKPEPETTITRSYFEAIDTDAKQNDPKIKTIKKIKIIAGNLTKDQLMADLTDDFPTNTMIIVSGFVNRGLHSIRIYRKGTDWIVYDPNYDHKELNTIHKILTKSQCIDEVFRILGTGLEIECCTFDEKTKINFPEYDKQVTTTPETLLEGYGLWKMAGYAPAQLTDILKNKNVDDEKRKKFRVVLASAMKSASKNGTTALYNIARNAPEALTEVVNLIDNSAEGENLAKAMIETLSKETNDGWTPLHLMAEHSPAALFALLKKVIPTHKTQIMRALTHAIPIKTESNWTPLHKLAQFAPGALVEILNLIDNSVDGVRLANVVADALSLQIKETWTGMHILAYYSPIAMPVLCNLMDDTSRGNVLRAGFASAFGKMNGNGFFVLRYLLTPDIALSALQVAIRAEQGLQLALRPLLITYKQDAAPLWNLYQPQLKTAIAALFAQELVKQPLELGTLTHSKEETEILSAAYLQAGRKRIYEADKGWLPNLGLYLKFQLETRDGLDAVLSDLSAKYDGNKTGWQHICDNMPHEKRFIMDAIKKHLATMSNAELLKYGKEIRQAFYLNDAKYRGICKKSNLFNYGKYVKTSLWKTMLATIQETLIKQNAGMQFRDNADLRLVMGE